MKNKIMKMVSLILLVTMIFNINKIEVKAANLCSWYTYQTYIDANGIYYGPSDSSNGIYGIVYDYAYTADDYGDHNYLNTRGAFSLGGGLGIEKATHEWNTGMWFRNFIYKPAESAIASGSCSDFPYVKVKFLDGDPYDGEPVLLVATEDEYKNFIKNQYSKVVDSKTGLVDDLKEQNRRTHKNFYVIAQNSKGLEEIVYTNKKTPYKTGVLDSLRVKLGDEGIEKFSTFGVDIGESSTRYELYNQVKDRWMPIARKGLIDSGYNFEAKKFESKKEVSDLSNGIGAIIIDFSTVLPLDRISFAAWFDLVQRYILEDYGLDDYVAFYTYAHQATNSDGNDKVSQLRELVYGSSEATESTDNSADGGILYADCMDRKLQQLEHNKCLQYCIGTDKCSDNSSQVIACQSGSEYMSCTNAYNTCKSNCKNIGSSSAKDDCIEQCVKEELGEEKYNSFISSYNNKYNEISGNANSAWEDAKEILSKIKAPSLTGIDFNGYEADCDDVVFLHKFYVFLKILAPILVILMGTIDYTKSVLGADEKKILEARKKFPKRLILLVLFILVPIIIEILLGLLSADTSLMYCVIKGA